MKDFTATVSILNSRLARLTEELDSFTAYEHCNYMEFNQHLDVKNPPYWIGKKRFAPCEILQTLDSSLYFDMFIKYTEELDITGLDSYIAIQKEVEAVKKALEEIEEASTSPFEVTI
tara:strand:+ start:877 stop:1227 length:351 start_codon:yes stop_codon:yes gene_type:complete